MLTPFNMSSSRLPDFKQSYFPYQELDRIHGQPTLHQIVKIYKQLKENAASVPTTLAGGQHGYLSLVLSDQQWMAIPNAVPFIRPVNPGPFLPRPGRATNADIAQDKARWKQRVADYNICQHLEATPHCATSSPPPSTLRFSTPSVTASPTPCNPLYLIS